MATDVTVLRVFTDVNGGFGSLLGVIDAAAVPEADRQHIATQLGYSETIFVGLPQAGHATVAAHIFTPAVESPFVGHPALGAAWWLETVARPFEACSSPSASFEIDYTAELTEIRAFAEWTPEFVLHELVSPRDVINADPSDYLDDFPHYVWAWIDRDAGSLRARSFAPELGVQKDEATGAAAIRISEHLSRDLTIKHGKGSVLHTRWSPNGWVGIAGRAVHSGVGHLI